MFYGNALDHLHKAGSERPERIYTEFHFDQGVANPGIDLMEVCPIAALCCLFVHHRKQLAGLIRKLQVNIHPATQD